MPTNNEDLHVSQVTGEKELTRMLAKLRLRSDLEANAKGVTEDIVDGFSDAEVSALPESTIVHIVDAYFILEKKGVPDQEIFKKIDLQRSLIGENTTVPAGTNLSQYIKWRLKVEFPQITSLEEMIVDMEILYAIKWFSRASKGARDWANADAFAAKAISATREKHQNTQTEIKETLVKPSSGKWKYFIGGLVMAIAVGAVVCWAFFMDGLKMFQ